MLAYVIVLTYLGYAEEGAYHGECRRRSRSGPHAELGAWIPFGHRRRGQSPGLGLRGRQLDMNESWYAAVVGQEVPDTLISPVPLIGRISRWVFGLPSGFQVVGAIAGAVLAVVLLRFVWKNRLAATDWLRKRSRGLQIAAIVSASVAIIIVSFAGVAGIDYTQHSNDFCQSCHVMDSAFTRFADSEHNARGCHDCHQQPISASMRQVYSWVLERPSEVGPHAPVASEVCAGCHITEEPDSTWQRVSPRRDTACISNRILSTSRT